MRLRFWICQAKQANIVGELRVAGGASLSSKFGGGTCTVPVSLSHLVTRDGSGVDVAAVANALQMTQPGMYSIVVTDHQRRCVGEWILMRRERSTAKGVVELTGMEWAGYPALRSLNAEFKYTNTDQMRIARDLLEGAFLSYNSGMQMNVPLLSSGVNRSMERLERSCYYSDALDELIAPDDGIEWHVDVAPVWEDGRLRRVVRTVVLGSPYIASASGIELVASEPGSRRGNAVISGGEDFSRYAQSVYGIGAGGGSKIRFSGLTDPTGTNAGLLNSTKNVSMTDIEDWDTLTALTQAELSRAQDIRDPFTATAVLEKLPALPRVGDSIRLRSDVSWGWPEGLDEQVRVGGVSYSTSGHGVQHVTVQAI